MTQATKVLSAAISINSILTGYKYQSYKRYGQLRCGQPNRDFGWTTHKVTNELSASSSITLLGKRIKIRRDSHIDSNVQCVGAHQSSPLLCFEPARVQRGLNPIKARYTLRVSMGRVHGPAREHR